MSTTEMPNPLNEVTAHLAHMQGHAVSCMLEDFCRSSPAQNPDGTYPQSLAQKIISSVHRKNDLRDFFDTVTQRAQATGVSTAVVTEFRMDLITMYLGRARAGLIREGGGWDEDILEVFAGPKGLTMDGPIAKHLEHLSQVSPHVRWEVKETDNDSDPKEDHDLILPEARLVRAAIRCHCPPLLALCADGLLQQKKDTMPTFLLAIDPIEMRIERSRPTELDNFNAANFAATLEAMERLGDSIHQVDGQGRGALHALAQTHQSHVEQKLPVLLAMGLDPDLKDQFEQTPAQRLRLFMPNAVATWKGIEDVFRARDAAMALITSLRPVAKSSPQA